VKTLPASAPRVVKSGAFAPTASALVAACGNISSAAAPTIPPIAVHFIQRFILFLLGWRAIVAQRCDKATRLALCSRKS
jgi:hypothetical protein